MFINQRFLVYLIGFHALKEFFPDLAMKLILASPAKWIKKHCQWESWIETSWNCLDRETEDALEKVLAYIKTNLLLQQQSFTLSHMKLVDIGREAKTCQRWFSIPWTLFLKYQVSQQLTWPQFKCQKYVKDCRGCHQPGVEAGMFPTISKSLSSGPQLTEKQSSSEVSAAAPTYTLEWLMYTGDMAHVMGVPSPNAFYWENVQIPKSYLSLLDLFFCKFISKVPFIRWLWSTLWKHTCLCKVDEITGVEQISGKESGPPEKDSHLGGDLPCWNCWCEVRCS